MGQVDAFVVGGLDLWFNSDDHRPPHFHARRPGEWEIRVFFLTCTIRDLRFEIKWGRGPGRTYRRELLARVEEYRDRLLEEWECKVCQ